MQTVYQRFDTHLALYIGLACINNTKPIKIMQALSPPPHFPSISLGYNKGMKPVCIESTLDIPVGNDLVRIWHEQVTLKDEYLSDRKLSKLVTMVFRKKKLSVQEKIDTVAYFEPNISAIQYVKNHRRPGSKYGVVVYLKDFNTDIHG